MFAVLLIFPSWQWNEWPFSFKNSLIFTSLMKNVRTQNDLINYEVLCTDPYILVYTWDVYHLRFVAYLVSPIIKAVNVQIRSLVMHLVVVKHIQTSTLSGSPKRTLLNWEYVSLGMEMSSSNEAYNPIARRLHRLHIRYWITELSRHACATLYKPCLKIHQSGMDTSVRWGICGGVSLICTQCQV